MRKINITEIDKLIENELTNVDSFSDTGQMGLSNMFDTDFDKPVSLFLDKSEKEEQEKLKYKTKLRSIDTDPNRRKSNDNDIAVSKQRLDKIAKLRNDLKVKKAEMLKLQQVQQLKMQSQMSTNNKNNNPEQNQQDNGINTLKRHIDSVYRESFEMVKDRFHSLPIIKRNMRLTEFTPQPTPEPTPVGNPVSQGMPQVPKRKVKVIFDKKTGNPFEAEFTERGFLIGTTRLSFEIIETALSKNFNITLEGGNGLVLDAIKMQKILKYKDKF